MVNIKCFNIAKAVIDEASDQFGRSWAPRADKLAILKQYCEAIDELAEEFAAEAFDVEVDNVQMTIGIAVECPDMTIESKSHVFYELLERAISVSYSVSPEGNLVIKFVFPSIWDRA